MSTDVKVRFPPSPTGFCHVGTARMALLNYAFARKHDGKIVFRSEDTDRARSKKEYEDDILDCLSWLGLSWDEFYRDSELIDSHRAALSQLIQEGKAYVSREESKQEVGKEVEIVRLKNPGSTITFHDIIRGDITFDTKDLGDFAIARAVDDPLYHLSVVVDDHQMGITHVIRGEEHISNTPRQILIQEALGYPRPQYAHYPLFLGADKSKLSKRKGDVAVRDYRENGFLPHALLDYIAHLGWTPPSEREFMTLLEIVGEFELENLHKSAGVFDMEKLRWYNRHYLLEMREDDFEAEAVRIMDAAIRERNLPWQETVGKKLMPLIRERISVWEDLKEQISAGEFDFFFTDPTLDPKSIPGKGSDVAHAVKHLQVIRDRFSAAPLEDFGSLEGIKNIVWNYAETEGKGAVLWPLRYALTGRQRSPDPFFVASIVGRDVALRRIGSAIDLLQKEI